ncbi:MAG: hypothetical protein FWE03_07420 [Firmicutes bacterium]|nr:hypothetical protein [Bacillota bacterium]
MKILYTSNLNIGIGDDEGKIQQHNSMYLEKYKQNLLNTAQKDDWKYSGAGAQFQGLTAPSAYEIEASSYSVNSVCPFSAESYIYSAVAKGVSATVSAIIKKNYEDGLEQFLINRNKENLDSMDYDGGDRIAVSVQSSDEAAKNIAILNIKTNDFFSLSGGDSIDEHPYFSRSHNNKVYFDSRGIGRDNSMRIVEYASSTICAIENNSRFEEVLSDPKFDVFCPKNDKDGNLYYLKKPHKKPKSKNIFRSLLDAILLPFWLVYGLFRLLVFFAGIAKRSSKKSQDKSFSNNPTKSQNVSERELYIQNQLINIEKEQKINSKKGAKYAGFAPKSIELWCMDKHGDHMQIAKGVLSYDLTSDNEIVYTNGRFCFLIDPNDEDAKPIVLFNDKLIDKIRINKTLDKPTETSVF